MRDVKWRDIHVGQIVRVERDEFFPVDLVLLSTSEPKGICFIETKNLDGETNLKHKQANEELQSLLTSDEIVSKITGQITCDAPNELLYSFEGRLEMYLNNTQYLISLDPSLILLRGSCL